MVSFPKISPNLLLGVGGIIAAVFLVSQIRKAGADVVGALPTVDEGLRQSITDIAAATARTTQAISGVTTTVSGIQQSFSESLKSISDVFSGILQPAPEEPFFEPAKEPSVGLLPQPEILECKCGTEIVQDATGLVTQKCIACPEPEIIGPLPEDRPTTLGEFAEIAEPQILEPAPELIPIAPVIQEFEGVQIFETGGVSVVGEQQFIIQENPIDTLSEVLNAFPELTASQAADFLSVHSGILPSELELVDPDIKNIVAAGGEIEGQVTVEPVTISELEAEAQRAAEFTCKEFGLNCELVDGMMA